MATKDLAERLREIVEEIIARIATQPPSEGLVLTAQRRLIEIAEADETGSDMPFYGVASTARSAANLIVRLAADKSEVESGLEGVTDAEVSVAMDRFFGITFGVEARGGDFDDMRAAIVAAVGSRLASAAKAEARLAKAERFIEEIKYRCEEARRRRTVGSAVNFILTGEGATAPSSERAEPCKICSGDGYTMEPEYYDDGQMSRTLSAQPCKCSERAEEGGK